MKKKNIIIVSCVFILAICLALYVDPLFWVIMPLLPASILFYLAILFSKSKWVGIIISLACIFVFFSVAEGYLYIAKPTLKQMVRGGSKYLLEGITTHDYQSNFISDPIFGYTTEPVKVETGSKRMDGDIVTYDVLYSWDEKGRRLTPDNIATAKNLVILFGCSYTFGEGLNDQETFAWQLSKLLGSDYQVLNYGLPGYGSHQMLALLESDRLDYLKTKYENVYAFYLTFAGIEQRSAGKAYWNQKGPKYVLNKDGSVSYAGQFDTQFTLSGKFGQSKFLKELVKLYTEYILKDSMLELHEALILKSEAIFKKEFGGELVTITYPNNEQLKEQLAKNNMEIIDMDMYFDDYSSNRLKYVHSKHDPHPNFEATKLIAKAMHEHLEKNQK